MTQPNLPATVVEEYGTGLEDIEDEVGAVPRIGINHPGGTFKDSLSGEEYPTIVGVALGMIKQRVFWDANVDGSNSKPRCKSQDAKTGYPNPAAEKDGGFPWSDATGLDPNTQAVDEFGRKIIDCSTCPFAEWGKDARTGKNTPPPCKERHTYPMIFNKEGDKYEPPYMESGIVSFQGAGISPSKKYLAAFVRAKLPLYSAVVRIKLNTNKRGTVTYSVPEFAKVAEVPHGDWEIYARDLQPMREYLTRPPRPDDDGSDPTRGHGQSSSAAAANAGVNVSQANVTVAEPPPAQAPPVQATVVQPAAPPAAPAPATAAPAAPVVDPDEDLPF